MHISLLACQSLQRVALQLRQTACELISQLHKFSYTEITDVTSRWLQLILSQAKNMLGSLVKTTHTSHQCSLDVCANAKTFRANNIHTSTPPHRNCSGQSGIPTFDWTVTENPGVTRSPAHTVSVQLSRTPSIGNQNLDQAKGSLPGVRSDNCGKEVTHPVASTKGPLGAVMRVSNRLNSGTCTHSRLRFFRCSVCLGARESPKITRSMSAHVGTFDAALRRKVETPTLNTSPCRRMNLSHHSLQSVSVPEGLNRFSYYRLAFVPPKHHSESETSVYSAEKKVIEVKRNAQYMYQHGCRSELHNTDPPQPSQCRLELCERLISEINQDLAKGDLTRRQIVSTNDSRHAQELTNHLLDQTIAVAFTYRMNQLSAVYTSNLSAVVTCSTLRVNELVDKFILDSFQTCKQDLHCTTIGRVPGVQRVIELALQLVNHLCDLLGFTADTTHKTQMAQLWADRLMHLAYPASCLAMDRILDLDTKFQSLDFKFEDRLHSNKAPVSHQLALHTVAPLLQSCSAIDPHSDFKTLGSSQSGDDAAITHRTMAVMSHVMPDVEHFERQALVCSPSSLVMVDDEHLALPDAARPNGAMWMGSKHFPPGKAEQTCSAANPTDCVYLNPRSGVIGEPNTKPPHSFSVLSCGSENGTDYADFSDSSSATYEEPGSESHEFHGSLRAYQMQTLICVPPDASHEDCRLKLVLSKKGSNPGPNYHSEKKKDKEFVLCSRCSQSLLAFLDFQQLDWHSFTSVANVAVQCDRVFSRTEIRRAPGASAEIDQVTTQLKLTDALAWTTDDATRTDPPTLSRCVSAVFVVPEEEPSVNVSSLRRTSTERPNKLLGSQANLAETRIDPGGDKEASNNQPTNVVCQAFSVESSRLADRLSNDILRREFHGCTEEGKLLTATNKALRPQWLNKRAQTKTGESVIKLKLNAQATSHSCGAYARGEKVRSIRCRQAVTVSSREKGTPKSHMPRKRQSGATKTDPAVSETTKCITTRMTHTSPVEPTKRRQELQTLFAMDPFYSCLEELKACLQKAESRLHAVEHVSDQGANNESRHIPRQTRAWVTKNAETSAIFTYSSGSRRRVNRWPSLSLLHQDSYAGHSYRNNEMRSSTQHKVTESHAVKPNPRNMHHKLNSGSRLCRTDRQRSHARWTVDEIPSKGPAHFPAPSMQLPIRQSWQVSPSRENAGLSRCLLYASVSSQRGYPAQYESGTGSVFVGNNEKGTLLNHFPGHTHRMHTGKTPGFL
ncbi:unnamed protein product [Dicrocoelium dendriticum]|nr:unnamed protein product [Dicrocoelium dendriticum]